MKKIVFMLFLAIHLNIAAEDFDKPIALEIINIPPEYNN
jgi:hypothetical protein